MCASKTAELKTQLKHCTKEELVEIVLRSADGLRIEAALIKIQAERVKKWFEEEKRLSELCKEAFEVYKEITEPWAGKKVKDIPSDVGIKAAKAWEEYCRLNEQYRKVSKKVSKLLLN